MRTVSYIFLSRGPVTRNLRPLDKRNTGFSPYSSRSSRLMPHPNTTTGRFSLPEDTNDLTLGLTEDSDGVGGGDMTASAGSSPSSSVSPPSSLPPLPLDYKPTSFTAVEWVLILLGVIVSTTGSYFGVQALLKAQNLIPTVWTFFGHAWTSYVPGVVGILAALALRAYFIEAQYKRLELTPHQVLSERCGELVTQASRLLKAPPDAGGIHVHYTVTRRRAGATSATNATNATNATSGVALHCYHGFGSWSTSWNSVRQSLADRLSGCTVTAGCMPGFGLTERPSRLEHYSSVVNARLGQAIVDHEASGGSNGSGQVTHHHEPVVLMGHSMGALSVAQHVIMHPELVKAVILVAPALPASSLARASSAGWLRALTRPLVALRAILLWFATRVGLGVANLLWVPSLRRLVRNRKFWEKGLRSAWCFSAAAGAQLDKVIVDGSGRRGFKSQVLQYYVDEYRKPQVMRGWERGLLNTVGVRAGGTPWPWVAAAEAWCHTATTGVQMAAALDTHNIPVLVIHGKEDRLVSLDNTRKLVENLPGSSLVELQGCGHVPHEEMPEEFVAQVEDFLKRKQIFL